MMNRRTMKWARVLSCLWSGMLILLLCQPIFPGRQALLAEGVAPEDVNAAEMTSETVADTADAESEATSENADASQQDAALERAREMLGAMTLEEKVGQMFIARCPEADAAQKVASYHLGGYILFAPDFAGRTKDEIVAAIESYQDASEIPLFIGVDEEGGTVNRVSLNPYLRAVPFWSPQDLYAEGGFPLVQSDTIEKSALLRSLGINVNLAPVCDVSLDPSDFIYERSFGKDAELTSEFVDLVVRTMRSEGMGSVLKHFPGYGNNADTHTGIAYDERPYETFLNSDFLPFEAGIQAGAEMVLVSHNIVSSMDAENPASLSPRVHEILRNELGFTGVIMTDDLFMEGVRDVAGDAEVAVRAVLAGNDLLCSTDFETQVPAVLEAAQEGSIPEELIDEAVLHILKTKIELGLVG